MCRTWFATSSCAAKVKVANLVPQTARNQVRRGAFRTRFGGVCRTWFATFRWCAAKVKVANLVPQANQVRETKRSEPGSAGCAEPGSRPSPCAAKVKVANLVPQRARYSVSFLTGGRPPDTPGGAFFPGLRVCESFDRCLRSTHRDSRTATAPDQGAASVGWPSRQFVGLLGRWGVVGFGQGCNRR